MFSKRPKKNFGRFGASAVESYCVSKLRQTQTEKPRDFYGFGCFAVHPDSPPKRSVDCFCYVRPKHALELFGERLPILCEREP